MCFLSRWNMNQVTLGAPGGGRTATRRGGLIPYACSIEAQGSIPAGGEGRSRR